MVIDPVTAPPALLDEGMAIDGFRLGERLHQGGMATLWSVTRIDGDESLPLVMKLPHILGGDSPAGNVGFEVEQMVMPALAGVHVPKFVARGEHAGQPYIVMERIAGEALRARLASAPLPVGELAQIGHKVATALHELHRQHVVHLDVRPGNIMFREEPGGARGEAVLLDFGRAHHARLPDLLQEELGLPAGTAAAISPEQLQSIRDDPRSDLFALGAMLYHLLTGAHPFGPPPTSARHLRQQLQQEPVPPRSLRPDCPPWLQETILRCLEVHADARHPSAAQLAFDLQHPDQVPLTERAHRVSRDGVWRRLRRWVGARGGKRATASAVAQTARSPIVLAAVDVDAAPAPLLEAMQLAVQRAMQAEAGARLVCLAVTQARQAGAVEPAHKDGARRRVELMARLRHWARPVGQALAATRPTAAQRHDARVTCHVIEAPDAAAAIVDYARRSHVDHIVMGARSNSAPRRGLGSVSAQVVAQSNCTVTVVRTADAAP